MSDWGWIVLLALVIGGCFCGTDYIKTHETIEMSRMGYVRGGVMDTKWVKP